MQSECEAEMFHFYLVRIQCVQQVHHLPKSKYSDQRENTTTNNFFLSIGVQESRVRQIILLYPQDNNDVNILCNSNNIRNFKLGAKPLE